MSPIFLRNQVTRFVILFVERSGSTYLATLLDAHEDVLARREEFAQMRQRGAGGAEQLEWASQFFSPPLVGKHKAIGFKTKIVDILNPDGFAQLLMEHNCRILQLHRRNAVKAAISTINAKRLYDASGNWNLLKESDRLEPFSVDLDEFERLLLERQEWDREVENYADRLKLPKMILYYEDLLLDENGFKQRVFDFIDVRNLPVEAKTKKNTQDDLRRAILNFDQLRNKFAGTIYEPMFDEVLT